MAVRFRLVKVHHNATHEGGFFRGDLIGKGEKAIASRVQLAIWRSQGDLSPTCSKTT